MTRVTPAGRPAHQFTYSPAGLLTTYTPPSVGDGAPPLRRMEHDPDGRLKHLLRQSGDSLVFSYDSTGRTTSVRSAETTTSHSYSATTGQLTSMSAPTRGTLSFPYDGALTTRQTWSGTVAGNVGFSYDSDLRTSAQTVNGANSVSFGYDADSLLTSAGALTLTRDAANGRVTGTTLGSVTTSTTYDAYSTPNRLTTLISGTPVFDLQHAHDSLGRIVTATEAIGGVTTTYGYTYDAVGRLSTVTKNGVLDASYGYDPNGNRTSVTTSSGTISAAVDAQDRLLTQGSTQYRYTSDGELRESITGTDSTRYVYAARGELLSVRLPNGTLIEYVHDPQGRRIGKKVNGTLVRGWLYGEGLGPVAELDGSNAIVSRFVYAGRANVPEYMVKGGITYRFVHDQLGSARLVVNATTGSIAQRLDYDAWGQVLTNTAPDFQPFGFAGGLHDVQTGSTRFGARDYSAAAARWTARDPIGFGAGDANLYRYASGDVINRLDPDGRFTLASAVTTAAIIGSATSSAITNARNIGKVKPDDYWAAFGVGFVAGLTGATITRIGGSLLYAGLGTATTSGLTDVGNAFFGLSEFCFRDAATKAGLKGIGGIVGAAAGLAAASATPGFEPGAKVLGSAAGSLSAEIGLSIAQQMNSVRSVFSGYDPCQ